MSEEIPIPSLSIPEDAFEQFQANTAIEEEEFITLSDLISPEPSLPSEGREIPYDNEVVLAPNFDDQFSEIPPGNNEVNIQLNSVTPPEINGTVEQVVEPTIEQPSNTDLSTEQTPGRTRRVRKPKSYEEVDEIFYSTKSRQIKKTPEQKQNSASKSKRSRKTKQRLTTHNESDTPASPTQSAQPDTTVNDEALVHEIPVAPKKGRKRASKAPNLQQQPDVTTSTGKQTPGRQRKQRKSNLKDNDIPPVEQSAELDTTVDNNDSSQLVDSNLDLGDARSKARGGRGKRKKIMPESLSSNHISEANDQSNNESDNVLTKTSKKQKGRRRKIKQEKLEIATNEKESDEDLDNMSLQALSNQYGTNMVDNENVKAEHSQNENLSDQDIDVEYDELSRVQDFLENHFEKDFEPNTEPQDMELEETVDSHNITTTESIKTEMSEVVPDSIANPEMKPEVGVEKEIKLENEEQHESEHQNGNVCDASDLLVEDGLKRPRRRAKKIMKYEEDSDEDPFANIELSDDDEPSSRRKRGRYNEDDEYRPEKESRKGSRRGASVSESEDSDISDVAEDLEGLSKRGRHRSTSKTPVKKNRKITQKSEDSTIHSEEVKRKLNEDALTSDVNVTTIVPTAEDPNDIEFCLQSSVIQAKKDDSNTSKSSNAWSNTNEFESFIAQKIQGTNLKIKKVSSNLSSQSAPLEIPVLDPEAKKSIDASVQTHVAKMETIGVQTTAKHEAPMKNNVELTAEQAEQACEFLKSIVTTTSELGKLMTEKSEDFISKKIHTGHVTDTFKMDYCVRKSFLLLKLAKHNIVQMEEDLSKQYDEFLKRTNLLQHRSEEKVITAKEKDNDSDCEIVEESTPQTSKAVKPKFNPKTVFLNKELSIKIAKKPTSNPIEKKCKQLNIKNKHAVWINDSVMVKKVKPTQSFLAQDSRNKKPPDCYVTEKMVSDFFENYYCNLSSSICAPFTSTEWLDFKRNYICCYFFVKPDKFAGASSSFHDNEEICLNSSANSSVSNVDDLKTSTKCTNTSPKCLIVLCMEVLKKQLSLQSFPSEYIRQPCTLFRLCVNALKHDIHVSLRSEKESEIYSLAEENDNNIINVSKCERDLKETKIDTFEEESKETINEELDTAVTHDSFESSSSDGSEIIVIEKKVLPLQTLCYRKLVDVMSSDSYEFNLKEIFTSNDHFNDENTIDEWNTTKYEDHVITCDNEDIRQYSQQTEVMPLKMICQRKINQLLSNNQNKHHVSSINTANESYSIDSYDSINSSDDDANLEDMLKDLDSFINNNEVGSLFSLCVKHVQSLLKRNRLTDENTNQKSVSVIAQPEKLYMLPTLKQLSFAFVQNIIFKNIDVNESIVSDKVNKVKRLADICFEIVTAYTSYDSDHPVTTEESPALTINCVNTVSEDVFHNMEEDNAEDEDGDFYNEDNYDEDYENLEETVQPEENWVSQLKLQVQQDISSYKMLNRKNDDNNAPEDTVSPNNETLEEPLPVCVKQEPLDEPAESIVNSPLVKAEPLNTDEIDDVSATMPLKQERDNDNENIDDPNERRIPLVRQNSSSFDVDSFEDFVRRNKMMHGLDEPTDDVFNPSGQRVRRQHEPDYMNEYDPSLNLLEPLTVENAKGVLMEDSSEEEGSKSSGQKKGDKRGRGRPKKGSSKLTKVVPEKSLPTKDKVPPVKDKPHPVSTPITEVAMLTRRMREKIRQEEKKVESSDSESENLPLIARKKNKEDDKTKSVKNDKPKTVDDEIQCNNVDSTEKMDVLNESPESTSKFTGFSAVDQNEITSYQKYVKFVYDKIIPKDSPTQSPKRDNIPECSSNIAEDESRADSPIIDYDEPTEMLECEPTMPIFDEESEPVIKKCGRAKSKSAKKPEIVPKHVEAQQPVTASEAVTETTYTERDGWHCYPIQSNETKLYQTPALILHKLPEDFVETYFRYQELNGTSKEDEEVDKLTNLNSLNRTALKEGRKIKSKGKSSGTENSSDQVNANLRSDTPTSEGCAELTASEDEGGNVDNEIPPPVPLRHANENHMAKNSLMGESDSDDGNTNIKREPNNDEETPEKPKSKKKSKSKQPEVEEPLGPDNLMLTADKMMNKELNLLHAPVVLSNELEKSGKLPATESKRRSGSKKNSSRDQIKNEDDSSSEEEKQWVNTKEKLLKRMKKSGSASTDDAKRAKLVCDFIERRGEGADCRKRMSKRKRRSSRKMLEREKQMRVLQHELLGTPLDPALTGTRHGKFSQSVFKGRRNIRKVIDKKSLQRSTVIANMEEFERKCRLNQRQAQLRELLGCEEGVNVLVINDEVCLEYSFEEQRPLVSVHPFFTRVMKAHQYEGVKFMWDACFESIEKVESGHPGGGCILAHCMGLGKTLQVLALLHTVLTHPRVGMQRVLVCCPLSTVLNWVDEIHKWIGPVTDRIKVFELSKLKKTYERAYQLEDWYSGGGIFIIGYELFRSLTTLDPEFDDVRPTIVNKIRTALLDPGPDIIVCDEGHLLKNDCSVLAVAMSRVATKRRIVLTGTPMQNNLREYYCMVNFIKPNLLGTYSEYSNRFENPIMNGQHRDSQEEDIKLMKQRTHILHKVLEGCLQRQEASVLYPYLPKKHEYTVFISLTQVQWDLYKHYVNHYSQKTGKQSVLRDFHILQKIWSHPQVLHNFQMKRRDEVNKIKPEKLEDDLAHEDLAASEDVKPLETDEAWWLNYQQESNMLDSLEMSNKFVVVFKILDECIALGDKVLIFSTSLFTMDSLEYFLKKINKWNLGQEYYRLDGSVPAEVRQKWCREFNAEHNLKTKLFLISTRAGSLGLNMVAANRVIILDTSWNPAHDIQSIFRVYRFGQKKDCYIYRLVALGTMEQKIYERSVTKQAVACRVVDEQQIDRHYNMAELTELYRYDEEGTSVVSGVAVGVEDVALLRVARLPALHAVHEHDSLLRGSSEQQLPEHERAAAWMQFQQEHAHKQMQNQLTSSFSLHLPTPNIMLPNGMVLPNNMVLPNGMMVSIPNVDTSIGIPETVIKQETTDNTEQPQPDLNANKNKKGKGKSKKNETNESEAPVDNPDKDTDYQPNSEPAKKKRGRKPKNKEQQPAEATYVGHIPPMVPQIKEEAKEIEEKMVKQIMDLLVQHNFQKRQGPREIADLVSSVRKMVAYGKVPPGNFDSALAKSIADVLLLKEGVATEPPPPETYTRRTRSKESAATPVPTLEELPPRKSRGRPKKVSTSNENSEASAPTTPQPSTSQQELEPPAFPGRRRAAINAEKQMNFGNTDDQDDWQNDDDSGGEEFIPDVPITAKKSPIKQEKEEQSKENQKQPLMESIVLSDDDDGPLGAPKAKAKPQPKSKKLEASKPVEEKKSDPEEPVPLHPSLLSNKNFIKIVAHTYLEGNPALDEDAAFLAAQYSTMKAKNEIENTGKPITSGSIYDIAIKVLGIDILKKLHKPIKANVPPAVKTEPLTEPAKPVQPPKEPTSPVETKPEVRKPGPRLKARKLGELTEEPATARKSPVPAAAPATTVASPFVVPVGFINRKGTIAPVATASEPFVPLAPPQAEESILPDDDDVIAGDILPTPPATPAAPVAPVVRPNLFKRSAKPLILNSVKAMEPKIPKLVISAGKLLPANPAASGPPVRLTRIARITQPTEPLKQQTTHTPMLELQPMSQPSDDTICLDSDEEEPAPAPPPPPKTGRKVALKSTAKPTVPRPAPPPVPVSLTSANPQLNDLLNQPHISPTIEPQQPLRLPPNTNSLFIPGNKLTRLPPGVIPANFLKQAQASSVAVPVNEPSILPTPTPIPESVTYIPQNPMYHQQMYQQPQIYQPQPMITPNIAYGTPPVVPAIPTPAPPPIAPVPMTGQKTLCKPGDILRITSTGAVEVLSREETEEALNKKPQKPSQQKTYEPAKKANSTTAQPKSTSSTSKPSASTTAQPKSMSNTSKPKSTSSTSKPSASTTTQQKPISSTSKPSRVPSPEPPKTPTLEPRSPERVRKISSSSSSSEGSRPSSPDNEDPLSILKDVVHIKAPEDPESKKILKNSNVKQVTATRALPNIPKKTTSSSSSGNLHNTTITPPKLQVSTSVTKPTPKPKSKATLADVSKHISKTDTILKKIEKSSGAKPKTTTIDIDTIDLDSYEAPPPKVVEKKQTPAKKPAPQPQLKSTEVAKKVVGTGKDIIISITGKSPSLSAANNSGRKTVMITNVEKISSPAAKRPAPAPAPAPKKKKTEEMTLKDFNIDDIDDIIELD